MGQAGSRPNLGSGPKQGIFIAFRRRIWAAKEPGTAGSAASALPDDCGGEEYQSDEGDNGADADSGDGA